MVVRVGNYHIGNRQLSSPTSRQTLINRHLRAKARPPVSGGTQYFSHFFARRIREKVRHDVVCLGNAGFRA
jgi:hypothetical protein